MMSVRKKVSVLFVAAMFFFTSVPTGAAVAGLQARSVEVSGPTQVAPRDGTILLARHKRWKKRLKRARRRIRRQVRQPVRQIRRQARRVEKRVIRPTIRKATPKPLRPLRKRISKQIKRTQRRVQKQVRRSSRQVQKQARRSGRQVEKQARRSGRQVEKEAKRTGRRVSKELKRFRKQLQTNQALGLLVKAVIVVTLGPQALILFNAIETVNNLAKSGGNPAALLQAGLSVLPLGPATPAGQALLKLAGDIDKLRTKRGREEFIKGAGWQDLRDAHCSESSDQW